ncbi:MAG TPA: ferrochelatase [Candidatus Angelobacter sp.]|nr:ferrochelatase [Candidatus Angelobacter sp.]
MSYEAILLVSFGGPESNEEVLPFLRNVLRGRNVPEQRMMEVAEHYYHFGGRSPINQQNRDLIAALNLELEQRGPRLPIYWGNRNWHPFLADTMRKMEQDGVRRALAFVTSAYSSYSSCRQYRENIVAAQAEVGPGAPQIDKLRVFYNHPGYIGATVQRVEDALSKLAPSVRDHAHLVYTAHSIPMSMSQTCDYVAQLQEASRLVGEALKRPDGRLVFQSRSGPPSQPWLEPDILEYLRALHRENRPSAVVVVPIGFTSDHMEVLYDLDTEAKALCDELEMPMVRAGTVGTHPLLIGMVRDLIAERIQQDVARLSLGSAGPSHDVCPPDCCPAAQRPAAAPQLSRLQVAPQN